MGGKNGQKVSSGESPDDETYSAGDAEADDGDDAVNRGEADA